MFINKVSLNLPFHPHIITDGRHCPSNNSDGRRYSGLSTRDVGRDGTSEMVRFAFPILSLISG